MFDWRSCRENIAKFRRKKIQSSKFHSNFLELKLRNSAIMIKAGCRRLGKQTVDPRSDGKFSKGLVKRRIAKRLMAKYLMEKRQMAKFLIAKRLMAKRLMAKFLMAKRRMTKCQTTFCRNPNINLLGSERTNSG